MQVSSGQLDESLIKKSLHNFGIHPIKQKHAYLGLNLSQMDIENIELLKNYTNIMYLDISKNMIQNINVLHCLPFLIQLNASNNQIDCCLPYTMVQSDLETESMVSMLTYINLSNNNITKVDNLSFHPFLKEIHLANNNITTTLGFQSLVFLKVLDLSYNKIEFLEGLETLDSLTEIHLQGNQLQSITGLSTLTNLSILNISDNFIVSLEFFHHHHHLHHHHDCNLIEIQMKNNLISRNVSEIDWLKELPWLSCLNLSGNPIAEMELYRAETIFRLPNLLKLDEQIITPEETILGAISLGKADDHGWI